MLDQRQEILPFASTDPISVIVNLSSSQNSVVAGAPKKLHYSALCMLKSLALHVDNNCELNTALRATAYHTHLNRRNVVT